MKVVMLKDVGGLGRRDTVIEVADGYALNSLIPQGKAVQATPEKVAQVEKRKAEESKAAGQRTEKLAQAIRKIDKEKVRLEVRANDRGHLFKGIKKDEVAKKLSDIAGIAIDPGMIDGIVDVIKETGEYTIRLTAAGVEASVSLAIDAVS